MKRKHHEPDEIIRILRGAEGRRTKELIDQAVEYTIKPVLLEAVKDLK